MGAGDAIGCGPMPLARYFAYIGSVLLALLFLLNWYLPPPVGEAARADVDRSTIRLQSRHKWPTAVVFDTSQPTIVPPPVAVTEQVPPAKSPLEALAMVQPKEPSPVVAAAPAAAPKRVVHRAKPRRPPPAPQIAGGYDMFGFRTPFPGGW
jgi:hypothetical protein